MAGMDRNELEFITSVTRAKTGFVDQEVAKMPIGKLALEANTLKLRALVHSMECHYAELMNQRGAMIPDEAKMLMHSMILFCRVMVEEQDTNVASFRTLFDQHP